jgi:hypothetical protein
VKAYVVTTGSLFALMVAVHIWRVIVEGPALATEPTFVIPSAVAVGLVFWSWRVFRTLRKP